MRILLLFILINILSVNSFGINNAFKVARRITNSLPIIKISFNDKIPINGIMMTSYQILNEILNNHLEQNIEILVNNQKYPLKTFLSMRPKGDFAIIYNNRSVNIQTIGSLLTARKIQKIARKFMTVNNQKLSLEDVISTYFPELSSRIKIVNLNGKDQIYLEDKEISVETLKDMMKEPKYLFDFNEMTKNGQKLGFNFLIYALESIPGINVIYKGQKMSVNDFALKYIKNFKGKIQFEYKGNLILDVKLLFSKISQYLLGNTLKFANETISMKDVLNILENNKSFSIWVPGLVHHGDLDLFLKTHNLENFPTLELFRNGIIMTKNDLENIVQEFIFNNVNVLDDLIDLDFKILYQSVIYDVKEFIEQFANVSVDFIITKDNEVVNHYDLENFIKNLNEEIELITTTEENTPIFQNVTNYPNISSTPENVTSYQNISPLSENITSYSNSSPLPEKITSYPNTSPMPENIINYSIIPEIFENITSYPSITHNNIEYTPRELITMFDNQYNDDSIKIIHDNITYTPEEYRLQYPGDDYKVLLGDYEVTASNLAELLHFDNPNLTKVDQYASVMSDYPNYGRKQIIEELITHNLENIYILYKGVFYKPEKFKQLFPETPGNFSVVQENRIIPQSKIPWLIKLGNDLNMKYNDPEYITKDILNLIFEQNSTDIEILYEKHQFTPEEFNEVFNNYYPITFFLFYKHKLINPKDLEEMIRLDEELDLNFSTISLTVETTTENTEKITEILPNDSLNNETLEDQIQIDNEEKHPTNDDTLTSTNIPVDTYVTPFPFGTENVTLENSENVVHPIPHNHPLNTISDTKSSDLQKFIERYLETMPRIVKIVKIPCHHVLAEDPSHGALSKPKEKDIPDGYSSKRKTVARGEVNAVPKDVDIFDQGQQVFLPSQSRNKIVRRLPQRLVQQKKLHLDDDLPIPTPIPSNDIKGKSWKPGTNEVKLPVQNVTRKGLKFTPQDVLLALVMQDKSNVMIQYEDRTYKPHKFASRFKSKVPDNFEIVRNGRRVSAEELSELLDQPAKNNTKLESVGPFPNINYKHLTFTPKDIVQALYEQNVPVKIEFEDKFMSPGQFLSNFKDLIPFPSNFNIYHDNCVVNPIYISQFVDLDKYVEVKNTKTDDLFPLLAYNDRIYEPREIIDFLIEQKPKNVLIVKEHEIFTPTEFKKIFWKGVPDNFQIYRKGRLVHPEDLAKIIDFGTNCSEEMSKDSPNLSKDKDSKETKTQKKEGMKDKASSTIVKEKADKAENVKIKVAKPDQTNATSDKAVSTIPDKQMNKTEDTKAKDTREKTPKPLEADFPRKHLDEQSVFHGAKKTTVTAQPAFSTNTPNYRSVYASDAYEPYYQYSPDRRYPYKSAHVPHRTIYKLAEKQMQTDYPIVNNYRDQYTMMYPMDNRNYTFTQTRDAPGRSMWDPYGYQRQEPQGYDYWHQNHPTHQSPANHQVHHGFQGHQQGHQGGYNQYNNIRSNNNQFGRTPELTAPSYPAYPMGTMPTFDAPKFYDPSNKQQYMKPGTQPGTQSNNIPNIIAPMYPELPGWHQYGSNKMYSISTIQPQSLLKSHFRKMGQDFSNYKPLIVQASETRLNEKVDRPVLPQKWSKGLLVDHSPNMKNDKEFQQLVGGTLKAPNKKEKRNQAAQLKNAADRPEVQADNIFSYADRMYKKHTMKKAKKNKSVNKDGPLDVKIIESPKPSNNSDDFAQNTSVSEPLPLTSSTQDVLVSDTNDDLISFDDYNPDDVKIYPDNFEQNYQKELLSDLTQEQDSRTVPKNTHWEVPEVTISRGRFPDLVVNDHIYGPEFVLRELVKRHVNLEVKHKGRTFTPKDYLEVFEGAELPKDFQIFLSNKEVSSQDLIDILRLGGEPKAKRFKNKLRGMFRPMANKKESNGE